jgi:hypothetical protein
MARSGLVQTILAGIILLLVVINILLALGNQSIQADMAERQQTIGQAIQLEQLNRQVLAVLADMAMKSNDEQLKDLLASSGVGMGAPVAPPSPSK